MTSDHPPTPARSPASTAALAAIPDGAYTATVVVASVVGGTLGGLVAWLVGATLEQSAAIGAAGLAIAALGLLPVFGKFLITPATWGLAVMGATAMQFLAALVLLLMMIEAFGLPRRPVVFGVLTATTVALLAETVCAVVLLAKRDAERERSAIAGLRSAQSNVPTNERTNELTNESMTASARGGNAAPAGRYA